MQLVLGLPGLCGLAWGHVHPEQEPCVNSHQDVLQAISALSVPLPPSLSLYRRGRGRHLLVCKSPKYNAGWEHGPDSHLPSSHSLLCSSLPYPPPRASYTWTSLAQQSRLRWKGGKWLATWQACFFYQEQREENRPRRNTAASFLPLAQASSWEKGCEKEQPINGTWVAATDPKPQETARSPTAVGGAGLAELQITHLRGAGPGLSLSAGIAPSSI